MTDPLLDDLITSLEVNQAVALVTVVKATGNYVEALGQRALVWLDKEPAGDLVLGPLTTRVLEEAGQSLSIRKSRMLTYKEDDGTIEVFVEVQRHRSTLIIVGAGHVALPLAQLGKMIDFEVVVLDDRPRYANQKRFPMADRVLAQPFQQALRNWPLDDDTYIVLVTRGHSHDVECLLEVLDSPVRYIGMIGSKRRVRTVFELLGKEQGVAPAKLDQIYAPIGLDIGAKSPVEIGISIMAEIINVYRGGQAISLSDALHPARSGT